MASFSRCVLSLALLFAGLFATASAQVSYNYSNFFNPVYGCSVTVGADGSIYVGICSSGTIVKLDSAFSATTFSSYNQALQLTLAPYNSNAINILELEQLGISGDTTLWFVDIYNERVLGVDSVTGTSAVKAINLANIGGVLGIGVTTASSNIWVNTPGASTGTATITQYDTNGNLLQTISSTNDPTNLPSGYFVFGVEPDPTNQFVYVGGCVSQGNIVYSPGQGFSYSTALGSFGPCDIREISLATKTVVLPLLSVSNATNSYYGTQNQFFFQQISVRGGSALNGAFPAGTVFAYDTTWTGATFAWNNVTNLLIGNFSYPTSSPAFTPANNFVFIGPGGQSVQQYSGAGTSAVYNITTLTFGNPEFVAVGNGGSPVYVASENCGPLVTMSAQAQITGNIGAANVTCAGVTAVDVSGNVYVIDELQNVGYQFTSSGTLVATYSYPNTGIGAGICVDPTNGNVAIPADNSSSTTQGAGFVLYYNNAGTLLNIFGQSIVFPFACAILSNSQIIVSGSGSTGTVYTINATTGVTSQFTDSNIPGSPELYGLAATNDGRVFVAALNLGIYIYSTSGQYLGILSAPQEDIYAFNMYYTTSGGGQLYVADLFSDRIVTFKVGNSGPSGSSGSAHTASSVAVTAAITVAALLFTLLISA